MHIRVPRSIAIGYLSTMMYIWLICTQRDANLKNYKFVYFSVIVLHFLIKFLKLE